MVAKLVLEVHLIDDLQVANMGGGEALVIDTLGRVITPSYHDRVTLHEAGHFLVAYLVGLLPRDYTLSALDAFKRQVSLGTGQGRADHDERRGLDECTCALAAA